MCLSRFHIVSGCWCDQAELEERHRNLEAETRKLEEEKRQAQAELEEQRLRAQVEAMELNELNKLATAEVQVQKQLVQAEQEKLLEQKRHLEQQKQQAAAAGVADLVLDPKHLDMDVTLPPLGSGTSADTRRGTYHFPAKAHPADVERRVRFEWPARAAPRSAPWPGA